MQIIRVAVNGCIACLLIATGWNLGSLLKAHHIKPALNEKMQTENFNLTEENSNENI